MSAKLDSGGEISSDAGGVPSSRNRRAGMDGVCGELRGRKERSVLHFTSGTQRRMGHAGVLVMLLCRYEQENRAAGRLCFGSF